MKTYRAHSTLTACLVTLALAPVGLACEPKDDYRDDDFHLDSLNPQPDNSQGGQSDESQDGQSDEAEDGQSNGDASQTPNEQAGPEACSEAGAEEDCGDGGVRFCDQIDGKLVWGECLDPDALECELGETQDCGVDIPGLEQACGLVDGRPQWAEDACNTPLVLSFDGGPVEYSAMSAASFDITGAGQCLATDWPTVRTPWLAIDLDKNGSIDGGHELFGSGTILPGGRHARNGFVALAQLDSNADGQISPADARWSELVLWSDHDGDRQSTLWELEPLEHHGVVSIALNYQNSRQCDGRGNCAVEQATFELAAQAAGDRQLGQVVDIHLSCQ